MAVAAEILTMKTTLRIYLMLSILWPKKTHLRKMRRKKKQKKLLKTHWNHIS